MDDRGEAAERTSRLFGWMGTICLFAILVIKGIRFAGHAAGSLVVGIAPSALGPAGLLLLLLSSPGRLSRLSLLQMTLLVAGISVAVEFAQLLPRPGFLARALYVFDPYDLGATLGGVLISWAVAAAILRQQEERP
jgi:hypothetical protein